MLSFKSFNNDFTDEHLFPHVLKSWVDVTLTVWIPLCVCVIAYFRSCPVIFSRAVKEVVVTDDSAKLRFTLSLQSLSVLPHHPHCHLPLTLHFIHSSFIFWILICCLAVTLSISIPPFLFSLPVIHPNILEVSLSMCVRMCFLSCVVCLCEFNTQKCEWEDSWLVSKWLKRSFSLLFPMLAVFLHTSQCSVKTFCWGEGWKTFW